LHNLFVFVVFFLGAQTVAGRDEPLNLRVFCNQRWIGGLAINKPDQTLDPESLLRIAPVN
jgi:hypothetical protein